MFIHNIKLQPSPVHGLGVFVLEKISQGEPVYRHRWKLDLQLTSKKFFRLDPRDQAFILHHGALDRRVNRYCLPYDNLRFLNHSDTPNLQFDPATDQIIALRDIRAGEELLQDYGEFEDNVETRLGRKETT